MIKVIFIFICLVFIYYAIGYAFGYSLYSDVIETKLHKYETDIRPKWLRNIIRIIVMTLWPICGCIFTLYFFYRLIIVLTTDFYNFWFK